MVAKGFPMKKPFVGLRPFRRAENELFFGRANDTAILRNLILAMPVLVVYAPSGTGKSSLLNAGALPVIEEDATLLPIVLSDPKDDVVYAVREKLASTGWRNDARSETGLAKTLERHLRDTDRRVILVLDQFEERLKESARLEALYAEIARLANTRTEAATVIISIREDYLAGLEPLMRRVTGLLDASFRVPSLSRASLSEAVYGPLKAASSEVTIDNGLVDEVLSDLERDTHLTESMDGHIEAGYFQIVWSHLWDQDATEPRHRLTRETYRREGGAAGILNSFVSGTIRQLLPFEAEMLRAVTRYMVLPTGAKVALTVDDLTGLLRADDFTPQGAKLQLLEDEKIAQNILESLFYQLTRTETPLFRRVIRGKREEFELVHDLLGLILLQWRLHYTAEAHTAANNTVTAVFKSKKMEEPDLIYASDSSDVHDLEMSMSYEQLTYDQPLDKRALSRLRSAKTILRHYTDNLKRVETVADVEQRLEELRSAFTEVSGLTSPGDYRYSAQRKVQESLGSPIETAKDQLRATGTYHNSRDVRRILQQQAYELEALKDYALGDSSYIRSARIHRGVAGWAATSAAGFALAAGGLSIARWLIEQVWHVPPVQYVLLTLAVIACGATLLYVGIYDGKARNAMMKWSAIRETLWPTDLLEGRAGNDKPWKNWWEYFAVLAWWPLLFVILELTCFAGAAFFQLVSWSPTAGFNLVALAAAIGGMFLYVWATDEF
jgi:hypothetical protein